MAAPRILVEGNGTRLAEGTEPLVLGSHGACDVVIDDPVVAARHCEFSFANGFVVRDLGSVTGTWVDGARVQGTVPLRDGSTVVIGTSRITARIGAQDGAPSLELQLDRGAFWWTKPGKGVFDNDPDAMVRSEVRFGRFPFLHGANRLLAVGSTALLLAALLIGSVMDRLADAGPLLPAHAELAAAAAGDVADVHANLARCVTVAREQACNACHVAGVGTPEAKCMQCHDDLARAPAFRHPYVVDGKMGPLPGIAVDEQFCVVCHRDHQGTDWLKPKSAQLVGQCETCHAGAGTPVTRQELMDRLPRIEVELVERTHDAYRFPHDVHVAKGIDCAVCHLPDAESVARADAGLPRDPRRQDFAAVPYETCAACHVPGSDAGGLSREQLQRWRPAEHQWPVAWHGTDEGGVHCKKCHEAVDRGSGTGFGPEFRTVARPSHTVEQHAAERARYSSDAHLHREQFAAHAKGKACTECHVRGEISPPPVPEPRTFWHALHLQDGSMAPAAGERSRISADGRAGCVSCHAGLAGSTELTDATHGTYHWPADATAQAACRECHREGERQLVLTPAATVVPPERRTQGPSIQFPHDVHLTSSLYGKEGTALAQGCYACHEFEQVPGGLDHQWIPRTLPKAADCTACHTGHDHVAGNSCQQCHPKETGRTNSFLVASLLAPGSRSPARAEPVPGLPTRPWPRNDGFSHRSPGHRGEETRCVDCHALEPLTKSKSLADVPVPDDAAPSCRNCHLQQQFHWR